MMRRSVIGWFLAVMRSAAFENGCWRGAIDQRTMYNMMSESSVCAYGSQGNCANMNSAGRKAPKQSRNLRSRYFWFGGSFETLEMADFTPSTFVEVRGLLGNVDPLSGASPIVGPPDDCAATAFCFIFC